MSILYTVYCIHCILYTLYSVLYLYMNASIQNICILHLPNTRHKRLDCLGRTVYIDEVKERLATGNLRVKKRCKTIKKEDVAGVSNKVKGTFMAIDKYKKES